jgi:monofunctional biosynthetic peptidoglycan transglycosylase
LALALTVALAALLLVHGSILLLRFVPPPTSAFMLRSALAGGRVDYRWVDWQRISPHARLAVVAAEDQRFPDHFGFDAHSLLDALEAGAKGGRLRGASTITQQVAKNVFLWPERSWLRKGLEAVLTLEIEFLWPKRRVLEVYLNVAEFGPGVFGVEAASRRFFGKSASALTAREAALLAAVLPSPGRLRAARPSRYVTERAREILGQMEQLGPLYLRDL